MTLIDTNILVDIVTNDPNWADWSIRQLDTAAMKGGLTINDIVFAELSVRFATIESLEAKLAETGSGRCSAVMLSAIDATFQRLI